MVSKLVLGWVLTLALGEALALTCAIPDTEPLQELRDTFDKADFVGVVRASDEYASHDVIELWKGQELSRIRIESFWGDVPGSDPGVVFLERFGGKYHVTVCLQMDPSQWRSHLIELYGEPRPPSTEVMAYSGFFYGLYMLVLAAISALVWGFVNNRSLYDDAASGSPRWLNR